jgi:cysteinyl-tRNA synthetase
MNIYNTLTKKKENFKPIIPGSVKIYICGPTVYNLFHIGNARSFIMGDIIRKYFEYKLFNVNYIMNLTDIDDKIIRKSKEENINFNDVSLKYIYAFFEDIRKLKIKDATLYPKATENIKEIIDLISNLISKDIAYNVDGNVFYDVSKFKGYGKLSGKNLNELEIGARVEVNEDKRNPLDFALWKKVKEGEPFWESPWGNGRPGWHIECSAMSMKYLGTPIDIHAGGNDLIFPHHENEIAQSEAATGKPFVNYWIHFGFLNIQNEKMSKSLGNFFTARDVLEKYSAETIRLFFAQTHYAGPLNFSEDLIIGAKKGLEKLQNLVEKIESGIKLQNDNTKSINFSFDIFRKEFESAMDDDFNTPQAVAVIFDFVRELNKIISENEKLNVEFYKTAKEFLRSTAEGVLGILDFTTSGSTSEKSLENELISLLISLRLKAKLDKNFKLADEIRDKLKDLGIILQDQKEITTFKKTNI